MDAGHVVNHAVTNSRAVTRPDYNPVRSFVSGNLFFQQQVISFGFQQAILIAANNGIFADFFGVR